MRLVLVALLAVLEPGCAARKAAGPDAPAGEDNARPATASAMSPARSTVGSKPEIRADEGVSGKVVLINPLLRFVVMDFPVRRMPAVDQRLNVYHDGRKTGEVKVTGPTRDTTIAGDITAGGAQVGDEVRED